MKVGFKHGLNQTFGLAVACLVELNLSTVFGKLSRVNPHHFPGLGRHRKFAFEDMVHRQGRIRWPGILCSSWLI